MSKSWPDEIDNPTFLESIYGDWPDVGSVEITKIEFDRHGPSLRLHFLSKSLPRNPPKKWGIFNTVAFVVELFQIEQLALEEFEGDGVSLMKYESQDSKKKLNMEGAVRGWFYFSSFAIRHISGLISEKEHY